MRVAVPLIAAFCLAAAPVCAQTPASQTTVPEPAGYRMDAYRAPVPATVAGGTRIDPQELAELVAHSHPVLIDVLPAPIKPPDARPDRPWLPLPHRVIPGSIWLPDVGRGAISPELDRRFQETLQAATGGDRSRPVVLYCLSRCWMSWNATKRAASYGYRRALWLEAGADGWEAAGHTLTLAK